jgi:hypothetical protein
MVTIEQVGGMSRMTTANAVDTQRGEEPLAIIVNLWMVLCFFDELDVCGG